MIESSPTPKGRDTAPLSLDEAPDELSAQGSISIRGDGSVAAGGDIKDSTVVTGNRNIVNSTINYITKSSPATLYQDAKRLFMQYRWCILGAVAIDILLLLAYQAYRDRFLLSWLTYSGLALLLSIVVWNWIILCRPGQLRTQRQLLYATFAATFLWFSLTTVEVRAKLYPPQFDDEQFGIAIATFSEGGNFRISSRSQQITAIAADELEEQIGLDRQLSEVVDTKVIGTVRNLEEGQREGQRVGAKLVVWGQILEKDEGIIVNFRILQAPDLVDNPSFPQMMTVAPRSVQGSFSVLAGESLRLTEMAGTQSLAVTAFTLGLYYYNKPDFRLAARQFEIALRHLEGLPNSAFVANTQLAYYYLGKSYQLIGDFERSREMLDRVLTIEPDDMAALLGQAYNYGVMEEAALRTVTLNQVISLSKRIELQVGTPAIYNRALAYEGLEDLEAALREYLAILKDEPGFYIAYISAGRVLTRLKRYEEAAQLYVQAANLATDQPERLVWLNIDRGTLYKVMGDPENALRLYDEAVALAPDLVTAYFYRALFHESQGNLDAALSDYQQVAKYSYQPGWAYGVLAQFLSKVGDYPGAIEAYLQALRYDHYNDSVLRVELALTYFAASEEDLPNHIKSARQQFEQALENPGPNEAYIRSAYGYMLGQIESVAEAIQQLEYALDLNPGLDVETTFNLALLYEADGKTASAIRLYRSVLEQAEQIAPDKVQVAEEQLRRLAVESTP